MDKFICCGNLSFLQAFRQVYLDRVLA